MLKKIELVSNQKIDNKSLNKIKGGWCCCANCVCGSLLPTTWSNDKANTAMGTTPLPPG